MFGKADIESGLVPVMTQRLYKLTYFLCIILEFSLLFWMFFIIYCGFNTHIHIAKKSNSLDG